jgi:molybdopterin-guanine dinucleotide biosynthesis protein A
MLALGNSNGWKFVMRNRITGVILAGGENKRFSGTNKAFIRIGGRYMLDHVYRIYDELFQDIILVADDPLQYLAWDFQIVSDLFPMKGSLVGIHAALFYATRPYIFAAACDTPFLQKGLIDTIASALEPQFDVVIPETERGLEPLCAVYSKSCLAPIERQLSAHKLKIQHFFGKVRVKKVPETRLRESDPDLLSFYNVNTPNDLRHAESIAAQNQTPN